MKKSELTKKLNERKEKALNFLKTKHSRWNNNDPVGLANANLKATEILRGIENILVEIEYIEDENSIFEILRKGEFQRYVAISDLLKREDVKEMKTKWQELFGNIENMQVLFDEPTYKFGILSIFETKPVYVIYTEII